MQFVLAGKAKNVFRLIELAAKRETEQKRREQCQKQPKH